MAQVTLETDPTGTNPANLVVREDHVLSEINTRTKRVLIPTHGPFYLTDLKLEAKYPDYHYVELVINVDYEPVLLYRAGEIGTGKKVMGGLRIISELAEGMLSLTYRALGTKWAGDRNYVLEALASSVYNPRISTWDMISGLPEVFPSNGHELSLEDSARLEQLIASINGIGDKLGEPFNPSLFYPQIVVEVLGKYEGVQQQLIALQNRVAELERRQGI